MKLLFITLLTLLTSVQAFGFYGEFTDEDTISSIGPVTKFEIKVFNAAQVGLRKECGDSECFRADIFLNGYHVARWAVSPGKKHYGTKFVGVFTPQYSGRSYHPNHLHTKYTNRFGDSMPWAAFIKRSNGAKSGIATHCGRVTGKRESHGCIRMVCTGGRNDASRVNRWVKEAFANGGTAQIWTSHTY